MSDRVVGRLADQWAEDLWDGIIAAVARNTSKKEIQRFLDGILSKRERKVLLRRIAILTLVRSGKSYKEIGRVLWASPQTVSAIKKNFLSKTSSYKGYKLSRQNKSGVASAEFSNSPIVDFIIEFLSLPIKVMEAFSRKGMGVTMRDNFER